jgi:hypothetical protein
MPELPAGSVASITITRLSVVPTDFWLALGAIATVLLAIATVYLGWQTRDVSRRTADLAQTTTVELDLLKQQTEATQEQAAASREQLKELRQQHEEAIRPVLSWRVGTPNQTQWREKIPALVILVDVVNYGPVTFLSRFRTDGGNAAVISAPGVLNHIADPASYFRVQLVLATPNERTDQVIDCSVDARTLSAGPRLTRFAAEVTVFHESGAWQARVVPL